MSERSYARRENWRLFATSFAITFLVIGLMALATVYWLSPPAPSNSEAPLGDGAYLPTAQDNFALLTAIEDADTGGLTFALVGFYPTRGSMPVAVFPRETLLVGEHKTDTLEGVYRTGGAAYAKAALESCYGLEINCWASVDAAGFVSIIDLLGSTDFRLPLDLTSPDGTVQLSAGVQQLDGQRAAQIITHTSYPQGEPQRCYVASQVVSSVINAHLPLVDSPAADPVFRAAVAAADTDFSQADYQQRKPAASFMARLDVSPSQVLTLTGSYNAAGNTFSLDESSIQALGRSFGSTQSEAGAQEG